MPETFLEAFQKWTGKQPDKIAFAFLDHQVEISQSYTYKELFDRSRNLSRHLLSSLQLKNGDRVLLVFPPSLDFMVAFIACLMAGIIAVPVFPPDPFQAKRDTGIFLSIMKSSGATIALTSNQYRRALSMAEMKNLFSSSMSLLNAIRWEVIDEMMSHGTAATSAASLSTESPLNPLAFLQYTSGSTSDPKGVMIGQDNLAHNLLSIITGLKAKEDTIVVSWLPQYHDMGLIGSYLGVLYCGGTGYYLSPMTFIKNPVLWVKAISKYRATHMQAPNFAYSLTAKKWLTNQRSLSTTTSLDLSCVRHMINAAEPVDPASIEMFYAVFPSLPRGVIYPTYGLAEHTVYVTSNGSGKISVDKKLLEENWIKVIHTTTTTSVEKGGQQTDRPATGGKKTRQTLEGGDGVVILLGCGIPTADVMIKIVHPETHLELSKDATTGYLPVGEIWIDSPSKAKGYWSLPEKSQEDFAAHLASSSSSDGSDQGRRGYLRTGDLGFLYQGEIYLCGRLKDMIIIHGKNYYPHDLEKTGESFQAQVLNKVEEEKGGLKVEAVSATATTATEAAKAVDTVKAAGNNEGSALDNAANVAGTSTSQKLLLELRKGCSAAFAHRSCGQEMVVYIAECSDIMMQTLQAYSSKQQQQMVIYEQFLQLLKQELLTMHNSNLAIAFLGLLPPRTIPKTSSGKIARQWVKKTFLAGSSGSDSLKYVATWSCLDSLPSNSSNSNNSVGSSLADSSTATAEAENITPSGLPPLPSSAMLTAAGDRIDPTGLPFSFITLELQTLLAKILTCSIEKIPITLPISAMGLDSAQGIQLQSLLDSKFTIPLPEELLFDLDVTITTIARSMISGGKYTHRPILLEGINVFRGEILRVNQGKKKPRVSSVSMGNKSSASAITAAAVQGLTGDNRDVIMILIMNAIRQCFGLFPPRPNNKAGANGSVGTTKMKTILSPVWFKEHAVKANIDTGKFPDGIARQEMKMMKWEYAVFMFYSAQLYSVFFYVPLIIVALFVYLPSSLHAIGVISLALAFIYLPEHASFPPLFRTHWNFGVTLQYFSYRMIIEAPLAAYDSGLPSIYCLGPHGVFPIGLAIQQLINGLVVNEDFHMLAAPIVFTVPLFGVLLKMLGYRSVDKATFTRTLLKEKHSVGVVPGGIAEMFTRQSHPDQETLVIQSRKGFVKIALETGVQIIPTYCFGNTQIFTSGSTPWLASLSRMLRTSLILFWGPYGLPIPHRKPMLMVLGTPIICPKVENPSLELVQEYHEMYLREVRRLYDTYKNTYDWQEKKLVFLSG